jgi:hypothetical protein
MNVGETGWGSVDWIGLAQDRVKCRALVNVVKNLRVPEIAGKLSSRFTTGGLSNNYDLSLSYALRTSM